MRTLRRPRDIFISPRWLELLAQRMRNAGIEEIRIDQTDWIIEINQAISSTQYRVGLDNEFAEVEIALVKKRLESGGTDCHICVKVKKRGRKARRA